MTRDLRRLFAPRSIAVIGGGAWGAATLRTARDFGFDGAVWAVHPTRAQIDGVPTVPRIADLPGAPDAAFIGVNRRAAVTAAAELSALGAGGAVCFASGFREAEAEDAGSAGLEAALVAAAGDMPILGPNCYGFVNALDRAALWPDQHGLVPVTRGVAILTQSSNIAINLTMQRRALPIATVIACGNAAQTTQPEIAAALLDDPRITALGLHVEGFGDLRAWEALAKAARARDLPVVVLKLGASDAARQATVSHTGALAGEAAGAAALLARLGFAQVHDLPAFVETLKLYHAVGRLPGNRIAAISCSGGEASLVADMAVGRDLAFAPLTGCQVETLRATLGPMVALANPLDYHTYIWRDAAAMARAWGAMGAGGAAITLSIVDYPTTDASDWACATEAALAVRAETGRPFAVAATLPELMPDEVAARFLDGGVVPFHGLREALAAIEAAARPLAPVADPLVLPGPAAAAVLLDEATAKAALAGHGMEVPRGVVAEADLGVAAASLRGPLALKALGLAHKSEAGALRLGLSADALDAAARQMPPGRFLIEEMVTDGVAELLVGVLRDPAHGFVLTLGAGGVLAELWNDTVSLLVPESREAVRLALQGLRIAPLLAGYRGKPGADIDKILDAIDAVQSYVTTHAATLAEVEINPLIVTPTRAVAADALIRKALP